MTKQEALAILERNADPYLADPAEVQRVADAFPGVEAGLAADALRAFRKWLDAFREDLSDLDGDRVFSCISIFRTSRATAIRLLTVA